MNPGGILLCEGGARARNLARAIRSVGPDVAVCSSVAEFEQSVRPNTAFVVVAAEGPQSEQFLSAFVALGPSELSKRCILLADFHKLDAFLRLLRADMCHHVISASLPNSLHRLSATLAGLIQGHSGGVEAFVPWGAQILGFEVRSSEPKSAIIDQMGEYLESMGIHQRLATLARIVADEFLMNALFDAPVSSNGTPLFSHTPRHENVLLPSPHRAEFRYCCTADRVYISMFDSFGSLTPAVLRQNLSRTLSGGDDQIRTGSKAGAGVGLYMSFSSLAEWIINIKPGHSTEMIGVLNAGGTYREHISTPKAFHLFVQGS